MAPTYRHRRSSVLVVEDDLDIRETMELLLTNAGYEVFPAGNGREALDLLSRIPAPGVILLDLMMPVMNGADFLQALRSDTRLSAIPVVVISASAMDKVPSRYLALRKPVALGELLRIVAEHCGPPKT